MLSAAPPTPALTCCSSRPRMMERAQRMKEREQTRITTTSKKSRKELSPAWGHTGDLISEVGGGTPGSRRAGGPLPPPLPLPKMLGSLHSLMSARLSRRIFTRPLCALLSNVIWERGGTEGDRWWDRQPPAPTPSPLAEHSR